MKFIYVLFALCIFVVLSTASPIDDDKCQNDCEHSYEPICCTDNEGKRRTFANLCVLKSENCLRKSNYHIISEGPCP